MSATSERAVAGLALTLCLLATALTLWLARDMTGSMAMPGGWAMSMAWMPMGAGWLDAALMFLAMWLAMMVAMMLPSAWPMLLLYRRTLVFRGDNAVLGQLGLAAAGYFLVWLGFGALAYAVGLGLSRAAMASAALSRTVPLLTAAALIVAGLWQVSAWKSACLVHCRNPVTELSRHLGRRLAALRLGLHHGAWCAGCCWGLMLVQLALGVMNLWLMAVLASWIALEKLAPFGPRLQRPGGALLLATGGWWLVQALAAGR